MKHLETHQGLEARRQIVVDELQPDHLRNHRVADGFEIELETKQELHKIGHNIAAFQHGMSELSNVALRADPKDQTMRLVRSLLGTENIHQAARRENVSAPVLPEPALAKADLIFTPLGLRIVEIEPGKLRGLGYGAMVRAQSPNALGIGAPRFLEAIRSAGNAAIVMSTKDRFHEPEIRLLARTTKELFVTPQTELKQIRDGLETRGQRIGEVIMMSPLVKGGINEDDIRNHAQVISDRRTDLESKGALALLHNAGNSTEIEQLLVLSFGGDQLARLRKVIPLTVHSSLVPKEEMSSLAEAIRRGDKAVFLKPLIDSGTRGIVTPNKPEECATVLDSKKRTKFIVQDAEECPLVEMESMDVLTGSEDSHPMNIRLTIHTDAKGQIIESTIVGSPDDHLAHGGTSSIITSLEVGNE